MGSLNVHKFGLWKKSKADISSAATGSFNRAEWSNIFAYSYIQFLTQLLLSIKFIRNSPALINDKATFQSYKPNTFFS
jgi:hypothetical protein